MTDKKTLVIQMLVKANKAEYRLLAGIVREGL
jgi:hypothetical protein